MIRKLYRRKWSSLGRMIRSDTKLFEIGKPSILGNAKVKFGELLLVYILSSLHFAAGHLFDLDHPLLILVPLDKGSLSHVVGVRQFSPSLLQSFLRPWIF